MNASEPVNSFSRSLWWAVRPLWVWRLVRLLVRSLWLGALLALAGWLYSAATGRPLAWHEWALIGAGLFVAFFLAQALWPMPARRLALRLDRRFELKDQLAAAHEVAGRGPRNYIESDLLEAADITFGDIRRHLLFKLHVPWNDLEMAVVVALAVVTAYYGLAALSLPPAPAIQHAAYEPLPAVGAEPVVQLPGVPAALQSSAPAQVGAGVDSDEPASVAQAAAAQEVLDALTQALSKQSLTEAAAAALSQGDVQRAADELRRLAQLAGSISDTARQDLAQSLNQAAERLDDSAPEQAGELRARADALNQNPGNTALLNAGTADALEGLAQMLESADGARALGFSQAGTATNNAGDGSGQDGSTGSGASGGNQGDSAGNGQNGHSGAGLSGSEEGSTGSVESLSEASVPVPLPQSQSLDPGTLRPADDPGQAYRRQAVPYVHVGASGESGAQPADPLSIPWRLRNVIQRYFSP